MQKISKIISISISCLILSCSHVKNTKIISKPKNTCLVLSVGGFNGIAHLGAIGAIKKHNIKIDCVIGNSMGSLIGSFYASEPNENTVERFKRFAKLYIEESKKDATDRGVGIGLFAGLLVIATGGAALPAIAIAGASGLAGASTINKVDHARFVRTINNFYKNLKIKDFKIPFVTYYQKKIGDSIELTDGSKDQISSIGSIIGGSCANPFIFTSMNVNSASKIDPGADRVSAIPITDACDKFPNNKLIVINVSGNDAFVKNNLQCPTLTIDIEPTQIKNPQSLINLGTEFDKLVSYGYFATMSQLNTENAKKFLEK